MARFQILVSIRCDSVSVSFSLLVLVVLNTGIPQRGPFELRKVSQHPKYGWDKTLHGRFEFVEPKSIFGKVRRWFRLGDGREYFEEPLNILLFCWSHANKEAIPFFKVPGKDIPVDKNPDVAPEGRHGRFVEEKDSVVTRLCFLDHFVLFSHLDGFFFGPLFDDVHMVLLWQRSDGSLHVDIVAVAVRCYP
jgi:hypothetical protein